jgi:hypothetical protein
MYEIEIYRPFMFRQQEGLIMIWFKAWEFRQWEQMVGDKLSLVLIHASHRNSKI